MMRLITLALLVTLATAAPNPNGTFVWPVSSNGNGTVNQFQMPSNGTINVRPPTVGFNNGTARALSDVLSYLDQNQQLVQQQILPLVQKIALLFPQFQQQIFALTQTQNMQQIQQLYQDISQQYPNFQQQIQMFMMQNQAEINQLMQTLMPIFQTKPKAFDLNNVMQQIQSQFQVNQQQIEAMIQQMSQQFSQIQQQIQGLNPAVQQQIQAMIQQNQAAINQMIQQFPQLAQLLQQFQSKPKVSQFQLSEQQIQTILQSNKGMLHQLIQQFPELEQLLQQFLNKPKAGGSKWFSPETIKKLIELNYAYASAGGDLNKGLQAVKTYIQNRPGYLINIDPEVATLVTKLISVNSEAELNQIISSYYSLISLLNQQTLTVEKAKQLYNVYFVAVGSQGTVQDGLTAIKKFLDSNYGFLDGVFSEVKNMVNDLVYISTPQTFDQLVNKYQSTLQQLQQYFQ